MKTYYTATCRDCDGYGPETPIPFSTPRERAQWWAAHKTGAGHTDMIITDAHIAKPLPDALDDFI